MGIFFETKIMIETILDKLDKVRPSGKNQWMACCPAHEDKTPSLGLKELHDGRILINCLAGCGGADIMAAMGLSLSDLYPDGELREWMRGGGSKRQRERKQEVTRHLEEQVLHIASEDRRKGKRLSAADLERERQAFMRLRNMGYK